MSANFQIAVKKRNGDLHLDPRGDFDGSSACELVNLLHQQYDGRGQIFIDTHNLAEMWPFGCSTFQYHLNLRKVPAERLFFKGEKGYEIAPRGSKVIVIPEKQRCGCKDDCVNCACSGDKKHS